MDSAIPRSMSPRAHPSRHGEPDVSRSSASRGKPMRSHTLPNVASLYSTLARTLPLPDSSLVLFDHDLRYLVAGGDDGATRESCRSGEDTAELQSQAKIVCRLLLAKK